MAGRGFFITGTDTDVGKTWSTVALMRVLQRQGHRVAGMKPVSAGCVWVDGAWRNQDALLLQSHASLVLDYASVNPYAFEHPVSPHIACGEVDVSLESISQACNALQTEVDVLLVEGAGGWHSPLSRHFDNAALAITLNLPVIIVVGMRLGCINHALLTWRAVRASTSCAGWVAVTLDASMQGFEDNLSYLKLAIDAPLLGVLPHMAVADFEQLADALQGFDFAKA